MWVWVTVVVLVLVLVNVQGLTAVHSLCDELLCCELTIQALHLGKMLWNCLQYADIFFADFNTMMWVSDPIFTVGSSSCRRLDVEAPDAQA